jgi:hypothetical protein
MILFGMNILAKYVVTLKNFLESVHNYVEHYLQNWWEVKQRGTLIGNIAKRLRTQGHFQLVDAVVNTDLSAKHEFSVHR